MVEAVGGADDPFGADQSSAANVAPTDSPEVTKRNLARREDIVVVVVVIVVMVVDL